MHRSGLTGTREQGVQRQDCRPALARRALYGQYRVVDETFASRLRTAFNQRDIKALRTMLAENATWGEDPDGESFCRDRDAIIRNLQRLLAEGVRATIVDTTTGRRGIAAHVQVDWPDPGTARQGRVDFYHVYLVAHGLVTEIHGHDDGDTALAAISD